MKRKKNKFRINSHNLGKFKIKHKLFAFFCVFIFLLILYIQKLALPIVIKNTETQLKAYATRSINYAVAETMNQNISYGDLIKIVKNENNDVDYIEANSIRINVLSKSMSKVVMANFLEFSKRPIKISLGSFSGISILNGFGPKIAFSVSPYGEVFCNFASSFESAGINQTFHKLYLIVSLDVSVVFPFKKLYLNSKSQVLLSETLIVGKIPEVYLNLNKLDDMLNLVPN